MKITNAGFVFLLFVFLQGCLPSRRFGTTIESDENNPCLINMIIQVGVEGTDADVEMIRSSLESCYGKECFIPCYPDTSKGCITKITVVVKKWGSINRDEQVGYHYVQMVDNDGLPSNAYIGTPNNGTSSGTWRRGQPAETYCHEVLHFCGLDDKYCSRLYDPVKDSIITELNCKPPPDPFGNCCIPNATQRRCTTPCEGHEMDIMGSGAALQCSNIMDVLKKAGFGDCPQVCCGSNSTFSRPPPEVYITPGYMNYGGKNAKIGMFGISAGYTSYLNSGIGITGDAGYYLHTEKESSYKETSQIINIDAGITYVPRKLIFSNFTIGLHALLGITNERQKQTSASSTYKYSETSINADIGAALNRKINRSWIFRIQASYCPTFFYEDIQHNIRVNAGVVKKLWK